MKERICTSLAINMFIVVCILILVSGCGVPGPRGDVTKNQRESEDILSEDKAEDSPDYEPKMIEMDQKEMDEVSGKLFALMEEAARKTDGVASAVVSFMTQKMTVEFAQGQEPGNVMKAVRKACKRVEPDCEIFL